MRCVSRAKNAFYSQGSIMDFTGRAVGSQHFADHLAVFQGRDGKGGRNLVVSCWGVWALRYIKVLALFILELHVILFDFFKLSCFG